MEALLLHAAHESAGARFLNVHGLEVVESYGDPARESDALTRTAAVVDLSFRGRVCLVGEDRQRFLNGQVTNDVNRLKPGEGCEAALVTAKGRIESDLNIHVLAEEILLDFEPGLSKRVVERLEQYVIADDVQVVDVREACGLLSVQGPGSAAVLAGAGFEAPFPKAPFVSRTIPAAGDAAGDTVLVRQGRFGFEGYDLVLPVGSMSEVWRRLADVARGLGGSTAGWRACETARIEAGIPRYGVDMDETNLAPETGLEARAISYSKGCYIGQEVIARIRTYGQVARALRPLELADGLEKLPERGDKLLLDGKEVGFVTSSVRSARFGKNLALGYVRKECNGEGQRLVLRTAEGESPVRVGRPLGSVQK